MEMHDIQKKINSLITRSIEFGKQQERTTKDRTEENEARSSTKAKLLQEEQRETMAWLKKYHEDLFEKEPLKEEQFKNAAEAAAYSRKIVGGIHEAALQVMHEANELMENPPESRHDENLGWLRIMSRHLENKIEWLLEALDIYYFKAAQERADKERPNDCE
jgi:hypothetical protein